MNGAGRPTLPAVFDDLDVGITLHDPETGAVLDVNEPLERLYGYSVDELRVMTVEDYTAPSTQFTQERAVEKIRAAAEGDPQVFEWHIKRSSGDLRWVRVHLSRTILDGEACVCAEIRDITGYREHERRLRLLSRIVRHNLRNEMTVLMGYAERIERAVETETLKEEIETVLNIAADVGALSESVRQVEEIVNPDTIQRTPTNLAAVVERRVEAARRDYPAADLTIEETTDTWTVADNGIDYAVEHAIENAVEHNDRATPTVTVTVESDPETDRNLIRIADNGPPIPEMERAVLDEEVETSSTYHGSGVGLWVMKWCVDSLGGELTFGENGPRGNVVTLCFPRVDPPRSET